jgi:hypothetical protein
MTNQKSAHSRGPSRFLPTPRDRLVLEAIRAHGRLTRQQIRRLFFRRSLGRLTSVQAVNARLLKLTRQGLLAPLVVSSGRGAGPYAYGLTSAGRAAVGMRGRGGIGTSVWHQLELAEIRVRLENTLQQRGGHLLEWRGDDALRALLHGTRGAPFPDALVHWQLDKSEGTFLLELDRGSESLAVLTAKVARYRSFFALRMHQGLLPGLGLRPRLAIVVASPERQRRLIRWCASRREERITIALAVLHDLLRDPLGAVWWRSDVGLPGRLVEQP